MKTKFTIYLLAFSLLACKKQEPAVTIVAGKALTSTRVTNNNGHTITTSYIYNNNGSLSEETVNDGGTGSTFHQKYAYKDSVLYLSEVYNNTRKLSSIVYYFTGNRITQMRYFEFDKNANPDLQFERNFQYQNNQLYKISTVSSSGQPGGYTEFVFTAGNITMAKTYTANGTLISIVDYEYDDKLNPYQGQHGQLHAATAYSRSNVVKATLTDVLSNTVTTSRYAYNYNSANQPITQYLASNPQQPLITYNY